MIRFFDYKFESLKCHKISYNLKLLFCFLFSVLLWLSARAQTDEPNMDSLIQSLNHDFRNDPIEESETDSLAIKLFNAWQEGRETFILETLDSLHNNNSIKADYFWGMALFNDAIPEEKARIILAIKDKLINRYSKDTAINKYLLTYELALAHFYYEPADVDKLTTKVLHLLATKQLKLESEALSLLYSLRIAILELEGKIKERDEFAISFYQKYPKELKSAYLMNQHYIGQDQEVIAAITIDSNSDVILIMLAAQSHLQLKNTVSAKAIFDELLKRYHSPDNKDKQQGGITTIFEKGIEGSTHFLTEDLQAMTAFYFDQNDKEQACLALSMLTASVRFDKEGAVLDKTKNDYLWGTTRKDLEQKKQAKKMAQEEKLDQLIIHWQQLCATK